jgi:uncharacterized protein
MERDEALAILKAHRDELQGAGVAGAALFGSVARGETRAHDIDVAVRLGESFSRPGLDYFSRLEDLQRRLSIVLGCRVDVVEEPVRNPRLQRKIDRDRVIAF